MGLNEHVIPLSAGVTVSPKYEYHDRSWLRVRFILLYLLYQGLNLLNL